MSGNSARTLWTVGWRDFAADATTTLTLHQLSESALRDTLTVKERGTANVLHALAQRNLLDERLLLLFCNSLAAVNAEIGQTGYATASAYLMHWHSNCVPATR